jgi:lipoprotein-anchoring transpeptidase ErfK/SrfK
MESIGTRASHGCIRMRPYDVIELYEKVPKYTPIYIHGGKVKEAR